MSPTKARSIRLDELRPGDILFFGPQGDPVSDSVPRLDTGRFSHVGLCTEPGFVVQARFHKPGDTAGDTSGLRKDPLKRIPEIAVGRALFAGRPRDEQRALGAAGRGNDLYAACEERRGSHSDFSIVKLFLAAAALHVFNPDLLEDPYGERTRHALFRAARAWAVPSEIDKAAQGSSFFCSEFVALAYDQPYTLQDFLPGPQAPEPEPTEPKKEGWLERLLKSDLNAVLRLFGRVTPEIEGRLGLPIDERWAATIEALGALELYDPVFVNHRIDEVVEFVTDTLRNECKEVIEVIVESPYFGIAPPDPLIDDVPPPIPLDTPLPASLVTPRMLERSDWLESIIEIKQP